MDKELILELLNKEKDQCLSFLPPQTTPYHMFHTPEVREQIKEQEERTQERLNRVRRSIAELG